MKIVIATIVTGVLVAFSGSAQAHEGGPHNL